ncbi:MAG: hypothetical protein M3O30_04560 [Planctomycetota bacterium]|nr:hypothetical protein [Planctomycetota bacterium]
MGRLKCWVLIAGFCVFLLPRSLRAQVGPDTLSMKVAEGVPSADRVELIVSSLRARDIALKQFTCELTEEDDAADVTHSSTPVRQSKQFVIKRNAEKTLISGVVVANGDEASDFTIAWDGSREYSIFNIPNSTRRRAEIRDSQQTVLRQIAYLHCLGVRVDDEDITLARWVGNQQNDLSRKVTGVLEAEGDSSMLVLEVTGNTFDKTFWLDPRRGNMVVKSSYIRGDSWETQTVEDSVYQGDIWIPTRVVRRGGTKGSTSPLHEDSYNVTYFSLAPLRDTDVQIAIPPGIHVIDYVRHMSFALDHQGTPHYFPLYDPQLGTITMNLPNGAAVEDEAQKGDTPTTTPSQDSAVPLRGAGWADGLLPNSTWLEASAEVAVGAGLLIAVRLGLNYPKLRRRRALRR